jgi:hypothetical protein
MAIKKCVKCGVPKESKAYGVIWLSNDGYCSVCNAIYKDRPRIKPIFAFSLKEGLTYENRDSRGGRITTRNQKIRADMKNKHRLMLKKYFIHKELKKGVKKLDKWL